MSELKQELKVLIIDALNLEDLTPDDIENDSPLFNEGLGLDSIDALELGMAIRKKYNVVFDEKDEGLRDHFASVTNLAGFIEAQGK